MKQSNMNSTLPYSKINTILLALLLVLAIGVFYVTYKQNHADDVDTAAIEEVSDYNEAEISIDELPTENL